MSLRSSNGSLLPLHVFRQRLADGADPNEIWIKHGSEMEVRIPLLSAVSMKDGKDHLQLLLFHPCIDVQVQDMAGYNALHLAIRLGNTAAIPFLVEAGVRVSAPDMFGYTPLHHAVVERNAEAVEHLVRAGAVIDARDRVGRTPLWLAAASCSHYAVGLLLSMGADPELRDEEGVSPYIAAQCAATANNTVRRAARDAAIGMFAEHRRKRLTTFARHEPEQVWRSAL